MDVAKSIRYAGMLVYASECDYGSFEELGLVCPHCGGTVFLVKEFRREAHTRKLRSGEVVPVSEAVIPAHFAHHNSEDEAVLNCPLRIRTTTSQEREAVITQSRGQLANHFRRKMWRMIGTSIKFYGRPLEAYAVELKAIWETADKIAPHPKNIKLKELVGILVDTLMQDLRRDETLSNIALQIDELLSIKDESYPQEVVDMLDQWNQKINPQLHKYVVLEALRYLSSKSQRPILSDLVEIGIANSLLIHVTRNQIGMRDGDGSTRADVYNKIISLGDCDLGVEMVKLCTNLLLMNPEKIETLYRFVMDDIVHILTFVNWGKQFAEQ